MRRLNLKELNDLPWYPSFLRMGTVGYLRVAANFFGIYKGSILFLEKGMTYSGNRAIIDLCSGGGGIMLSVQKHLKAPAKILLTDKYPDDVKISINRLKNNYIIYLPAPTDALNMVSPGFRTMYTSAHHFNEQELSKIISNAAKTSSPIAIFEATKRNWLYILLMLLTPICVFFLMPFVRPIRFTNIFFTYIMPVIPLCTMYDGIISCLRSYTVTELREIAQKANPDYCWTCEESAIITHLYGEPSQKNGQ